MTGYPVYDHRAVQLTREQVRFLARNYDTLAYSKGLRLLLGSVFNHTDFSQYSKRMLHHYLNDSLISNCTDETALKFQLFRYAVRKDLVAAFETPVQNSRLDFLTINGVSTSFEIKSELDNLGKLGKQAGNYVKVFEYNYVIVDSKHIANALRLLPSSYGVIRFEASKRITERKAALNIDIDPLAQVNMLTKKERRKAFEGLHEETEIRSRFNEVAINDRFKQTLKARYRNRWKFLVQHRDHILPIDLQFFFNRNIDPQVIYNHG